MQESWEMHDFLDTHDGFHFLIAFLKFFAKRVGFSGFPYEILHISAPAFIPGAVFDDGKLGSQTAQKRPSLGGWLWRGQKGKNRLYKGKAWIFDENYYLSGKCIFCQNIDTP
jgi:hypothetical protein